MDKCLLIVGLQKEKIELCGKKGKDIVTWVQAHSDKYDYTIAVNRVNMGYDNFKKTGDSFIGVIDSKHSIAVDQMIEVSGFDLECSKMRKDVEYHIVGISTSASVLCIAMSMYSVGLNVKVLSNRCCDRKSSKLHDYAIKIMENYMPLSLK